MTSDVTYVVVLTGGLVVLVCAVLVFRRAFTRFSSSSAREDLTVSDTWLLEHKTRKNGD